MGEWENNLIKLARAEQGILSFDQMRESLGEFESNQETWEREFQDVQSHLMFVGYPRSGHSLIGALLDAHPEMVVAHELNVLQLVEKNFTRSQIFFLELLNSRAYAKIGRIWGPYSYAVPNQFQGKYQKLRVMGDKKGGHSSFLLSTKPELFTKAQSVLGPSTKVIHVVRHPLDNISTISQKHGHRSLKESIEYYFVLCNSVQEVKKRVKPEDFFEISNEDFIQEPKARLSTICEFLDVTPFQDFLKDCASIVAPGKGLTRNKITWSEADLELVRIESRRFPFLQRYEI